MRIAANHTVEGARLEPIPGGSPMLTRRVLVIHFTGGASTMSSVVAMRQRRVSAHVVVDRDGTVIQCRPFNLTAEHAGRSRWVDPKTGVLYKGVNSVGIGIEIANAGFDPGALAWARRQAGFAGTLEACHRNGEKILEWEVYPAAQLAAVTDLSRALVDRYRLDDVTGHDCIAPERKLDPGPAFPMAELRAACGFSGLPEVHRPG